MANQLSCCIVIATAFRYSTLTNTLHHINSQYLIPDRVIIADGAPAPGVEQLIADLRKEMSYPLQYHRCKNQGAAIQRNEASELVTEDIIFFMDDDVYIEPECLKQMMDVLEKDHKHEIGGVGSILTNQYYRRPGRLHKKWLDFMAGEKAESYAGRVIGPALNFLPDMADDGNVMEVEWLNSTCTAYRTGAFKSELFARHFYGYSFGEDLHLSLRIAKKWRLVVATAAKAFHDSQPSHFKHPFLIGRMSVENRYLTMSDVMGKKSLNDKIKFLLSVFFSLVTNIRNVKSVQDFMNYLMLCTGSLAGFFARRKG